ncbi:hypothetical protein Tco_0258407, partial [Tanacetum coccineum]
MLCDLDFEPLSLSLSSLPSCDLVSLANIRKSPIKSLFDADSSRISIFTVNTYSITRMLQISQGYWVGLLLTACELDDVQQVLEMEYITCVSPLQMRQVSVERNPNGWEGLCIASLGPRCRFQYQQSTYDSDSICIDPVSAL